MNVVLEQQVILSKSRQQHDWQVSVLLNSVGSMHCYNFTKECICATKMRKYIDYMYIRTSFSLHWCHTFTFGVQGFQLSSAETILVRPNANPQNNQRLRISLYHS